jgi:hypothetical protein
VGDKNVDLDLGNFMDVHWTALRFGTWVGSCGNVQLWVLCERCV